MHVRYFTHVAYLLSLIFKVENKIMNILLIGGAESVGKTSAIVRLAKRLKEKGFNVIAGSMPANSEDFRVVLKGNNQKGDNIGIIINSPSDTIKNIELFKEFIDTNGEYDIMISSIRDAPISPREHFFTTLNLDDNANILEIPFGKMTRRGNNWDNQIAWFEEKMDNLIDKILESPPYNI